MLTIGVLGALRYFNFRLNIHDKYLQLAVTSLAFALVSSIALYAVGVRAPAATWNPNALTSLRLTNFNEGVQSRPRIRSLDIKFVYHRISLLAVVSSAFLEEFESEVLVDSKEPQGRLNGTLRFREELIQYGN